jgi:hypothetical protein
MTVFSVIHEGWQLLLGPKMHPSSDQGQEADSESTESLD